MTNGFSKTACALTLLIALPSAALAELRGQAAPASRQAPAARSAAPASRPAPVSRPAPAARPAPQAAQGPSNAGGFNFNRDINARTAPVQRQVTPQQPTVRQQPVAPQQPAVRRQPIVRQQPVTAQQPNVRNQPVTRGQPIVRQQPANPRTANYPRAPFTNTGNAPYHRRSYGPELRNAHAPNGAWGWNHNVVWQPAPVYWGGGFWGPFALGALTDALLFGSIVDDQDRLIYPSYQVEADSPGEQLLRDYGLQQTQCGQANLVVIWGPDNSVICAFANDSVGPGQYEVDPATFTLLPVSQ